MLNRQQNEFARYFFTNKVHSHRFVFSSLFGMTDNRNSVSEIIKDRVYLSNLPTSTPFSGHDLTTDTEGAALVVSCMDITELAESWLLLEPESDKIKYHVLAMEDVSAKVGGVEQVYDTLKLMSEFADKQKPIHIHCYSGVGRSAMITAMHLAHRYLLNDPIVVACVDEILIKHNTKLNPDSDDFISKLYFAVSSYVVKKRNCCQFTNTQRNDFAISILKEISIKIQCEQEIVNQQDDNYLFIAEFVQSPEFKKLQYHYFNSLMPGKELIQKFYHAFLTNEEGWYQMLMNAINSDESGVNEAVSCLSLRVWQELLNPEQDFSEQDVPESQGELWSEILAGVVEVVKRLAEKYPGAGYGEQVVLGQEEKQHNSFSMSC